MSELDYTLEAEDENGKYLESWGSFVPRFFFDYRGGNAMKVFLSLGMHGRTMEDIHKDISTMKRELRRRYPDKELIFVDNADCTGLDADGRLYYLGEAIKKMDKCDAVYFHSGYKNHKGCLIEEKICELYGLKKIVQGS